MYSYKNARTAAKTRTRQSLPTGKKSVHGTASNNTGLPNSLKVGIENLSGYSMDNVRVHYNSPKPAQLSAYAYTQGTEIHIAPGQEKHLPHEAWHVVQQMQGRVRPTLKINSVNVNDNPALEHEATVLGARANGYSGVTQLNAKTAISQPCIQMKLNSRDLDKILKSDRYYFYSKNRKLYTDPADNYRRIKEMIEEVAPGSGVPDNVREIAERLEMAIEVPPSPVIPLSNVERSRFSAIPNTCDDVQLRKIIDDPTQSPIIDKDSGKQFYHIEGRYPAQGKPIWQIDGGGLIKIVGMYRHTAENRNHYTQYKKYRKTGDGPRVINLE